MTPARGRSRADADTNYHAIPQALLIRSWGRASGGQIIGRRRAWEPMPCGCCRCRIARGDLVFEVLTASDLLNVCTDCVGRTE
jgi:hypothetical protein